VDHRAYRHSGESRKPLRQPCVYLLASGRNGTLQQVSHQIYFSVFGSTKNDVVGVFTKRHAVHTLVWYEGHDRMDSAITREKAIKKWKDPGKSI
jgi:putative endonuclease